MVGQLTIELANEHQAEFLRRAEARRGVRRAEARRGVRRSQRSWRVRRSRPLVVEAEVV
jgi:hypothetical protein